MQAQLIFEGSEAAGFTSGCCLDSLSAVAIGHSHIVCLGCSMSDCESDAYNAPKYTPTNASDGRIRANLWLFVIIHAINPQKSLGWGIISPWDNPTRKICHC